MADYLEVKYSQMAMYESGERSLPSAAMVKLGQLEIDFEECKKNGKTGHTVQKIQETINQQEEKMAESILRKTSLHRYKVKRSEDRLEALIKKQQDLISWLHLIDQRLSAEPGSAEHPDKFTAWWEIQLLDATQLLPKMSKELAKLRFDVDLLRAVADVHEAHHERLKKTVVAGNGNMDN